MPEVAQRSATCGITEVSRSPHRPHCQLAKGTTFARSAAGAFPAAKYSAHRNDLVWSLMPEHHHTKVQASQCHLSLEPSHARSSRAIHGPVFTSPQLSVEHFLCQSRTKLPHHAVGELLFCLLGTRYGGPGLHFAQEVCARRHGDSAEPPSQRVFLAVAIAVAAGHVSKE